MTIDGVGDSLSLREALFATKSDPAPRDRAKPRRPKDDGTSTKSGNLSKFRLSRFWIPLQNRDLPLLDSARERDFPLFGFRPEAGFQRAEQKAEPEERDFALTPRRTLP